MPAAMEPAYPSQLHYGYVPDLGDGRLETVDEECADVRFNVARGLFGDSDDEREHGVYLPSAKRQRTGFNCTHCNMAFTEKRALARHKKTDHHRRQLGLPPDRKHACHICGKHFTRGHDLKRHQNEQHADVGGAMEILSAGSEHSSDRAPSVDDYLPMQVPVHARAKAPPAVMPFTPPSLPPTRDHISVQKYRDPGPRRHSETSTQHYSEPRYARRSGSMQATMKHEQTLRDFEAEFTSTPTGSSTDSVPQLTSGGSSDTDMESDRVSELFPPLHVSELFPPFQTRSPVGDSRYTTMLENRTSSYGQEPGSWQPVMCAMCGDAFEDDAEELVKHLRRHLDSFTGKHRCKECQIDFIHEEDLERHQQSVIADGNCGFKFPHRCTGHHPPNTGMDDGQLTDFDRVRLCVRLQEWEQAQLQAYMAEINDLTSARNQRKLARWSDILRGGSTRRTSHSSFAISVNTNATAPCDVSDGKMDLGGLQKRLQQMSLGSAGSRFRRKTNPEAKDARSKTIDKTLAKAVRHGDLQKVKSQLTIGGDSKIVHDDQGTFVTVALWGHTYIARRMAEHRVDEDITGKCSVCKMTSSTFTKPANKVRSLLMHSADPNEPGGLHGHPLSTAAWMGKTDLVSLLLQFGGEMRQGGGKFGNALCSAAAEAGYQGQADVIDLLIKEGADVRIAGPEGSAIDLARARRSHWSMQLAEATTSEEELEFTQRIASCDSVLLTLQAKSNMLDAKDAAAISYGSHNNRDSTRSSMGTSAYPYW